MNDFAILLPVDGPPSRIAASDVASGRRRCAVRSRLRRRSPVARRGCRGARARRSSSPAVQGVHFVLGHRERWALLLVLRIFQRDQQAAAAAWQLRIQTRRVALAQRRRQRDQRGAVVDARAVGQDRAIERERIAAEQFDVAGAVVRAVAGFADGRHQSVLGEELLDRKLGQLNTVNVYCNLTHTYCCLRQLQSSK